MPNHFATIGLPVETPADLSPLARRIVKSSRIFETDRGDYLRWASDSGAEVWLQADIDKRLNGVHPHFSGKSVVRVGLTRTVVHPEATALDGGFHAWAEPHNDSPEDGHYPFIFDAPDFLLHQNLTLPCVAMVQIAAFAYEVTVFDSLQAYNATQTGEMKWAAQSFIPEGLLAHRREPEHSPTALATIRGHILETELRTNELAGLAFYWVLVQTYGAVIDVVIDPQIVNEPIKIGGVIAGSFWLSGRLLS